jgi:hypothetical protein
MGMSRGKTRKKKGRAVGGIITRGKLEIKEKREEEGCMERNRYLHKRDEEKKIKIK